LFGAAVWAVIETPLESLAAAVAANCLQIRSGRINRAHFVGDMTAALTLDKRLALANAKNGNKEEGQVVIRADEIGLTQATIGTDAWLGLEFFPSGSYPTDENHLAVSFLVTSALSSRHSLS
jgi:hypothetical protein